MSFLVDRGNSIRYYRGINMTTPLPPQEPSGREREPQRSTRRLRDRVAVGYDITQNTADVRAHYDAKYEIIQMMVDGLPYSCAFFSRPDMTLAEAQTYKMDLTIGKLNLKPNDSLLDIGCGDGDLLMRAQDTKGIVGTGITLSTRQVAHARARVEKEERVGLEFLEEGWQDYGKRGVQHDAADSVGTFEHVREEQYGDFFKMVHDVLFDNGLFLLHTIHIWEIPPGERLNFARFLKFLGHDIFPNGYLPTAPQIYEFSQKAGFELLNEDHHGPDYVRTLALWKENLEAQADEAIRVAGREVYEMYRGPYLEGTQKWFGNGAMDVTQFLLRKKPR